MISAALTPKASVAYIPRIVQLAQSLCAEWAVAQHVKAFDSMKTFAFQVLHVAYATATAVAAAMTISVSASCGVMLHLTRVLECPPVASTIPSQYSDALPQYGKQHYDFIRVLYWQH